MSSDERHASAYFLSINCGIGSWLAENLSVLVKLAITLENAFGIRKLLKIFVPLHGLRFFISHFHAFAGQPDGCGHHRVERLLAPMSLRIYQSRHRTGHANGFV